MTTWMQEHQSRKKLPIGFSPYQGNTMTSEDEAWVTVVEWLSKLRTLQGVPFVYIVPTEEMLPNESIRFFHIDRNWLDALVDGAISVGTLDSRGSLPAVGDDNEELKYQRLIQELNNSEINKNPYRNKLLGEAKQSESSDEYPSGGSTSGFLLRSTVVRDFPGLEVSAYEAPGISSDHPEQWAISDKRIQTIYQVRLSETILLCIFNGIPTHLRLQEPGEGIRLGLDPHKPPLDDPINLGNEITNRYTLKYKKRNGDIADPPWTGGPNPKDPTAPWTPSSTSLIAYRVHTGDRSVIDITGVLSKTIAIDSHLGEDPEEDPRLTAGGLVATQLMQFPYQQDFGYDSITQHPYGDSQTATVEESDILTNVQAEQEDDRYDTGVLHDKKYGGDD